MFTPWSLTGVVFEILRLSLLDMLNCISCWKRTIHLWSFFESLKIFVNFQCQLNLIIFHVNFHSIYQKNSVDRNFIWLIDLTETELSKLHSKFGALLKSYLVYSISCFNIHLRRTVKSTLLLVPLLGISNIPLFYEPSQPSSVYMLGSAILQHSQVVFQIVP